MVFISKRISTSTKKQILEESDDPKCVITNLELKYGITANQIYTWRSNRNKSKANISGSNEGFIELVPNVVESPPKPISIENIQMELKFSDFTFSMQGKISKKKCQQVIGILSSAC